MMLTTLLTAISIESVEALIAMYLPTVLSILATVLSIVKVIQNTKSMGERVNDQVDTFKNETLAQCRAQMESIYAKIDEQSEKQLKEMEQRAITQTQMYETQRTNRQLANQMNELLTKIDHVERKEV